MSRIKNKEEKCSQTHIYEVQYHDFCFANYISNVLNQLFWQRDVGVGRDGVGVGELKGEGTHRQM